MRDKNFAIRIVIVLGLVMTILSPMMAVPAAAEDFTIIVLPDTQHYSESYPNIYVDQTEWIVANKDALNIVYVVHVGDLVENANQTNQWQNVDNAMSLLEDPITTGLLDGIPYGVVPGNHDHPTTNYNVYFGFLRFSGRTYYGGHYGTDNNNNYTLFSASGMNFIVINLDYYDMIPGTPDHQSILDWAENLLQTYNNHRAIVVSHYIMNVGEQASFGPQGQAIYDALKDNPNLFLMLCGHQHGEDKRVNVFNGNTVYTLLANYQDYINGGNGFLRILRFSPETDEIRVKTYSPTLNQYERDVDSEFILSYDMPYDAPPPTEPPNAPTNLTATVASASQINLSWTDNADNESGFQIELSTDGGETFTPLTTVSANTEEYLHRELAPATEYCYRVRATNIIGNSDYSEVACATTAIEVSFREGVDGYTGTVDTYIMQDEPTTDHGALESVEWDTDDPYGSGQEKFALIRFDDIFGSSSGQIPLGATIHSATLTYVVYADGGHRADVNEIMVDWPESVTYNTFGGDPGVQTDEYGTLVASASGSIAGVHSIDVTASLSDWAGDPSANRGWIFRPTGDDGVDFRSSEYIGNIAQRPCLRVNYTCGVGDINCDGLINIFDLQLVINCILGSGSCDRCDLNDDGLYNIFDLQLVINAILEL